MHRAIHYAVHRARTPGRAHASPSLSVTTNLIWILQAVREQTGLAMKVCRQALEESGDDVTAALAWIEANAAARGE